MYNNMYNQYDILCTYNKNNDMKEYININISFNKKGIIFDSHLKGILIHTVLNKF